MQVQSAINLYGAAVWLKADAIRHLRTRSNMEVVIDRSTFQNNERGLMVVGNFKNFTIVDCLFKDNLAVHSGAGLFIMARAGSQMFLINTVFSGNSAGYLRHKNDKMD